MVQELNEEKAMGNYISIGIVYSDKNRNDFDIDLNYFITMLKETTKRITVSFPKDNSFNEWSSREFYPDNYWEVFSILEQNNMAVGEFVYTFCEKKYRLRILVKQDKNKYLGILFEICAEDLINNSTTNTQCITNKIIKFLEKLSGVLNFAYAFCDNEADIEYSPAEILKMNKAIYSILVLNEGKRDPKVLLGSWCIDGLTPQ